MALKNSSIEDMNTFLGRTYYIPNYQRDYAWEDSELEDFWKDLITTKNDTSGLTHFFGQIVIHDDDDQKKKFIIDGQQRSITSTIFMRVLQLNFEDLYRQNAALIKADYKKSDIASRHIGRADELHLILGELDRDYFEKEIQLGIPDRNKKEKKKSHEKIKHAFYFFTDKINEELASCLDENDKFDVLCSLYFTFTERFNVIYMEATKLEEAFVIFETLNARGRELETADLLKNFIFSQSNDINSAQKKWNLMNNKLGKVDATKYIRHFWNSREEMARERELYRIISRNVSNPRASKELLINLEKYADYYHDVSFPDDCNVLTDTSLINSLNALKILKAKSFYPVVLAMLQTDKLSDEKSIRDVVRSIESYVFKNATICGHVANKAEVFFANMAKDIYDGKLDDVASIVALISKATVPEDEFADSFERWTGNKSGKETIRYILRKIHKHLDKANELNIDTSEVHIEHIMPENATKWNVSPDEHEAYLWRLGNLTLLSGKLNTSISNDIFANKKDAYKDSKIEPNGILLDYAAWGPAEIEDRQKRLAQYAKKIWK